MNDNEMAANAQTIREAVAPQFDKAIAASLREHASTDDELVNRVIGGAALMLLMRDIIIMAKATGVDDGVLRGQVEVTLRACAKGGL